MASLDATLENIIAEMLQRANEKNRLKHEATHAQEKADEAEQKFEDCRKIIGETYKTGTERRIVYNRSLITISPAGYVEVKSIETIK